MEAKRRVQRQVAELFRTPHPRFRSVSVSIEADGSLVMSTQDMGPDVEQTWGDADYEFWTRVPAHAVALLAWRLLTERHSGHADATDLLRNYCQQHGIPCEWGSWT